MKKIKLLMTMAAVLTLSLAGQFSAQAQGFGGGGGMDFQNMDPTEVQKMVQQRINDSYREQMDVTNDTEWALIEERITAVTKARTAMMADGGGMMGGMRGGFGGGGGAGGPGGGGGFARMFGKPSPESTALQDAVNNNAPAAQIKTLMTKFEEVRKQKQAALAKAQEDLRSVLTTRQEAVALLGGLLN